jgi:predicted dehydrogenase
VAVVGTGSSARVHAEALRSLDEHLQIVAGVGSDAGHAGFALVCTSDVGDARAALAAGVHAVVEPTLSLSLRGLDDLDAAQVPGGPYAAMVFPLRFGSGVRRLRALVADGVLGRPLLAVCHTLMNVDGSTMGPGVHQIDVLTCVLGEWTEVEAAAHRLAGPGQTEDVSLAHVTFAGGAVASIVNSALSPREESYLRFDFERATVELTHVRGYGDDDWRITPVPGHEPTVLPAWKAGEHGRRSGHAAQFAEVLEGLGKGRPPPVRMADVRATMSLVAGIYAAAFTGQRVVPGDVEPGSAFYERMNGFGPPWS